MVESADLYWHNMISGAVCGIDNKNKKNGICKSYTSGRNADHGNINGQITGDDIQKLIKIGKNKGWRLDSLALPEEIWYDLLRTKSFQKILLSNMAIIPTSSMPVDPVHETSSVLVFNSQKPSQAISALSVKIEDQIFPSFSEAFDE